jgi:hypothetical protein
MVLAGVGPWTFVQQLPQMIGCGPEVAFPSLALSVAVPVSGLQVFDHPLPHQHARLHTAGFCKSAQLVDPLMRQPQSIYRRTGEPRAYTRYGVL